jgi:hypothetical protein
VQLHPNFLKFEVLTAVTMKNAVFWDTETSSYLTGNTSPLQSTAGCCYVRFKVLTAATMKNIVFCDVMPCGVIGTDVSKERTTSIIRITIGEIGTTSAIELIFLRSMIRLLVTVKDVSSLFILVPLMMGGDKFLRNVGYYKSHTTSNCRKQHSLSNDNYEHRLAPSSDLFFLEKN